MRQLSAKQKKLLTKVFEEAPNYNKPFSVEDLDTEAYFEIEEINPHETYYQNVNRFISDLYFDWQRRQ